MVPCAAKLLLLCRNSTFNRNLLFTTFRFSSTNLSINHHTSMKPPAPTPNSQATVPQGQEDLVPFFFGESPSSPAAIALSPLFRIPPELRGNIYNFLYCHMEYGFSDANFWIFLAYRRPSMDAELSKFPLWLLTCKQLLSEGAAQFYRVVWRCGSGVCNAESV
ncbi:hypothetical protein K469DRAFT_346046 [Zopfia rhizophila CBS 207.26]|uniref:Uncharacterized protein n=1 Tax=Zopfia rhizophila CBS 207.26 TaxID=1314779 RepID=A0A6A6EK34_9PEZI|nr:hypothetical protein K469DRAFT_346046 [Zopfia rhizophila CBS 207.26]